MRDRIIHAYFEVDYNLIWDIVMDDVPLLERTLERLIDQLSSSL